MSFQSRSANYHAELEHPGRPRLASRFVCRALLDAESGEDVTAGWRRLHAAWACDDAGQAGEARVQRIASLDLFDRARANGQRVMKDTAGGDEALLADLARRAGEFERAKSYLAAGRAHGDGAEFVIALLLLQEQLVLSRDIARHTVAELEARPGKAVH